MVALTPSLETLNLKFESEDVPVKVELPKDSSLRRLVPPHSLVSREVTEDDLAHLAKEAPALYAICYEPTDKYMGAYALAHPQIDGKDPLRFFIIGKKIIINPEIRQHVNYIIDSPEGCYSFLGRELIVVKRWHKIKVEYTTLMLHPKDKDKYAFSSLIKEDLSGKDAIIFQHEFDHLNSVYIYAI